MLYLVSNFLFFCFFFFTSRRRHTRYWRDWSSDVCSSDLVRPPTRAVAVPARVLNVRANGRRRSTERRPPTRKTTFVRRVLDRKERRVGKECRSRWSPYH